MKLVDSASIIAAITAYFYSVSTAYTYGYFHTLGLDADLLDRNFQQIIYDGFIISITHLLYLFVIIFVIIILVSLVRVGTSTIARNSFRTARTVAKMRKLLPLTSKKMTAIENRCYNNIVKSALLFFLSCYMITILSGHEKDGIASASRVIKNITNNSNITFKVKDYKHDMTYLYCGAKNCAGYDATENKIIYVPHSQMEVKNEKFKSKLTDVVK